MQVLPKGAEDGEELRIQMNVVEAGESSRTPESVTGSEVSW
jgi:hypothetical protein